MVLPVESAYACSCSFGLLNSDDVAAAGQVFQFRLLRARLEPEGETVPLRTWVVGDIEITDVFRGEPAWTQMQYSTQMTCCGSRFDIGGEYVAFISGGDAVLFAHHQNVLELGLFYSRDEIVERIGLASNGVPINDVFPAHVRDRTMQMPTPSPPCLPREVAVPDAVP